MTGATKSPAPLVAQMLKVKTRLGDIYIYMSKNLLDEANLKVRRKVGIKLQKIRKEQGLTQTFVAGKLGYDCGQLVSNFERGECLPPLKTLDSLAKLYKMSAKELKNDYMKAEIEIVKNIYKDQFDLW